MLTEKISGYTEKSVIDYLWFTAGICIVLSGYAKLFGASTQPTYRELEVTTEKLESGLNATIVSGMYGDWGDSVSLAVDGNFKPHIVYRNSDCRLELADVNESGKWRALTLGPPSNGGWRSSGAWNSIILDEEGYTHISSSIGDGRNENLLYFTDRDGWQSHQASIGQSVGLLNDLALDSNGDVHISHWQWNSGRLLYSTNKSGDWVTIILDEDATWRQTSISIDSSDNKYISYNGNKILVLEADGITRTTQELQLTESPESKSVLDKNDCLHLVGTQGWDYSNGRYYFKDLVYMNNEEDWQPNIISQEAKSFFNSNLVYSFDKSSYDDYSSTGSIAIDPNGKVHIAIVCSEGYPTFDDTLIYVTNKLGNWKTFLIDRSLGCHNPEIVVDTNDNVHIAYSEDNGIGYIYFTTRKVKYVTFNTSELSVPFKLFAGLCYQPYKEASDPNSAASLSIEQINEDLLSISGLTSYVRTYSIDNNMFNIPELSYSKGLNCFAGVELSGDEALNEQATESALNLAKKAQHSLISIVLGNETILRGELTDTQITGYINNLRRKINSANPVISPKPKYITTAEDWSIWLSDSQLRNAADLILANIYPYRDGISIESAAAYVVQIYNQLNALNNKYVVITTCWPSQGEIIGSAVPSIENQTRFMQEFTQLAEENNVPYFYLEEP